MSWCGGDSISLAGADGVQANSIECDAKCDAIVGDRIELLTRAVILVAGMKLAFGSVGPERDDL